MLNIYVYMLAVACLRLSVEAAGKTVHVVFSNHLVSPDEGSPAPHSMAFKDCNHIIQN